MLEKETEKARERMKEALERSETYREKLSVAVVSSLRYMDSG